MLLETETDNAIVETITQPLLVLDGELRVRSANPAFLKHFKVNGKETEGTLVYDLGNGQWNIPDLHRLLEDVLNEGGAPVVDYRVEHYFKDLGHRIMLVNANRMHRGEEPDRILVAISDITEREELRLKLEGRQEFAEKLIDSVREGLIVLGLDLCVHSANQSFYDTFNVSPGATDGRLVYELGNGQWDIPELRQLLEDILPHEQTFDDYEVEHEFESIGRRIMLLNGRRLDHQNLILLAIRDVTQSRQAEKHQQLLMGELQHRVKNILNNVSALASMTRRRSRDLDQFFQAFSARLDGLARTQDLLVQGPSGSVDVREIVRLELNAVGAQEGVNYLVHGPTVTVSPRVAQPLAMTVHELATNAAKYGALSVPNGQIDLVWRSEQRNEEPHLAFEWRERGVPVENVTPEKGFGSQLIKTTLPHQVGGTVDLRLEPGGAVCEMVIPLGT
jgi:two-component sensor histidine kinase/PAS domain-containing protein